MSEALIADLVRERVPDPPAGPRLNIGCGLNILDGWMNADIVALPGVQVVADASAGWPWRDGSLSEVRASHLFEHVADAVRFMAEAHRVLAPGGLLDIRVPGGRAVEPGYWLPHSHSLTDPTHVRHCTPATWDYWVSGASLHDGFGAAFGSPPAVFEMETLSGNGGQGEELQVILRKEAQ
jgi:SAM-dependent methyltransferase